MNQPIEKLKQNIDWKLIISGLVLLMISGGVVYAAKASGFRTAATIMAGGK